MEAELARRRQKVIKYEKFVEERLKVDLQHVVNERSKFLEQKRVFTELAQGIKMLQASGSTKMKSMVDLGSQVFMQAQVPDTSRIFVDVGLGFHVEFTLEEALAFAGKKEKLLQGKADACTQQAANIKSQIKLVLEGIRELMGLPPERVEPTRRWGQ